MQPNESDIAIRAGVASFVLAAGAATATFLANRRRETQTMAVVGSALALSAAAFAVLGLRANTSAAAMTHAPGNALEIVRAADLLRAIAATAQAGSRGDPAAVEAAFAMISRDASVASELLARIELPRAGVKQT